MTLFAGLTAIFDLDGTLVDSAPDLSAALNRALAREGLGSLDPQTVRPLVGEGARALLKHGFAEHSRLFPEGEAGDRLVETYIEDYASRISELSFAFPGVEETLQQLLDGGAVLAVCTNKVERLAEPLLRDLGLRKFFSQVVCADSLAEKKPSALPLLHIIEATRAGKALLVGDTVTDLRAAEAADIPCLIASFGYGAGDPILDRARTFEQFKELPGMIQALSNQNR